MLLFPVFVSHRIRALELSTGKKRSKKSEQLRRPASSFSFYLSIYLSPRSEKRRIEVKLAARRGGGSGEGGEAGGFLPRCEDSAYANPGANSWTRLAGTGRWIFCPGTGLPCDVYTEPFFLPDREKEPFSAVWKEPFRLPNARNQGWIYTCHVSSFERPHSESLMERLMKRGKKRNEAIKRLLVSRFVSP